MPTIRYRSRRRIAGPTKLDAWQEFILLHATPARLAALWGPGWEPIAEAAWEIHGERLTTGWIARRPGSRPPLWWALDAPGKRPIVNAAPPELEARWRRESTLFGVVVADVLHPHGPPGQLVPWLEPERSYLDRHGLLIDADQPAAV